MENKYLDLNGLTCFKKKIGDLFPTYIKNINISNSDWTNNKITLKSSAIKPDSIINIYFSEASKPFVGEYNISYLLGDGFIQISSSSPVTCDLYIESLEIINPNIYDTLDNM